MSSFARKLVFTAALLGVACYAVFALRGPQGMPSFLEKRDEIRTLQMQNADLARENERKRERIKRLKESEEEQRLEIRKRLKLLRPNEKEFIFGEEKPADKPDASR